ncbi:mCG147583 [Mus musculus]|nr:mCG147583 [Mus musculus]
MFTYRERESGLRSVHILRASHTDARLRHSQPANSLIGGPRPPARITAGPKPRRRRRRSRRLRPPSSPPELEPSPPSRPCSPFGAEAEGGGDGAGGGAGEERQARGLLTSPAALPSPERQRLQVVFPPGARTNAGGASSLPNERRPGGPGVGREGVHVLRGAAWTHNGGRSGGDFLKGLLESGPSEEGSAGLPGLSCLSNYPVGPSITPLT